jgi:hypothetical protein
MPLISQLSYLGGPILYLFGGSLLKTKEKNGSPHSHGLPAAFIQPRAGRIDLQCAQGCLPLPACHHLFGWLCAICISIDIHIYINKNVYIYTINISIYLCMNINPNRFLLYIYTYICIQVYIYTYIIPYYPIVSPLCSILKPLE